MSSTPVVPLTATTLSLQLDMPARYVVKDGGNNPQRYTVLADIAKWFQTTPQQVLERFIALSRTPQEGLLILDWTLQTYRTVTDPNSLDYQNRLLVPAGWWTKVHRAATKWEVHHVSLVEHIQVDPLKGFLPGTIHPFEKSPGKFVLQVGYLKDGRPTPRATYGKPPRFVYATCLECQEAKAVCPGHHGCRAPHTLRNLSKYMEMVRAGHAHLVESPEKGYVIVWYDPEED